MSNAPPEIESLLPLKAPPRRVSRDAPRVVRARLSSARARLVVLDDDPTGTQTVHDVPVYLDWSPASLAEALREDSDVVYISTNSRALGRRAAADLGRTLGGRVREVADDARTQVLLASRSDSTLRGHYPAEVEGLMEGFGAPVDGVLICPAFFEGGRYTAGDIHYVLQGSSLIPAAETEFARDPMFGYVHSNLREWVAERVGSGLRPEDVVSISLELLRRRGPQAVCEALMEVARKTHVVVNAVCYEDLEQFVLGLAEAESRGRRFVYRCAASFVKARGGVEDRPLLTRRELDGPSGPGLVAVGSWVEQTNRQLAHLLADSEVVGLELDARAAGCEEAAVRRSAAESVAAAADSALAAGRTTVIYTSRPVVSASPGQFAAVGRTIMATLCEAVGWLDVEPGFVVAKGGITSIEIARSALGAGRAAVLGQIAEGVPVWRLAAGSKWADLPYVVFPGNVGTESTLRDVVRALEGRA